MKYSDRINTEILATIGPSLGDVEKIKQAIKLGVRNFRIHMGVRSRDRFQYFQSVRDAETESLEQVEVLIDLPTAKPRVGIMDNIRPSIGEVYKVIDADRTDSSFTIPLRGLSKLFAGILIGERVVFSDGKLVFRIIDKKQKELYMECLCANTDFVSQISSCVFPDSNVEFELFDQDDLEVLQKMRNHGLSPDWVAISFASGKEQIDHIKKIVGSIWNTKIKYMAKIESRKGLQNISEILENVDGIMVARGDLLSFVEPYTLPYIQHDLIIKARKKRKVTVVATEMLEQFSRSGVICRPELNDIALAVRQKASAVMLSVESSNSERAEECISLMNDIIQYESGRFSDKRL